MRSKRSDTPDIVHHLRKKGGAVYCAHKDIRNFLSFLEKYKEEGFRWVEGQSPIRYVPSSDCDGFVIYIHDGHLTYDDEMTYNPDRHILFPWECSLDY